MIISHTYAQEHLFTILYINVPKLLIEYIDRIRRKRVEEHENDVRERIIHVTSIVVRRLLCNAKVILRTGILQKPTLASYLVTLVSYDLVTLLVACSGSCIFNYSSFQLLYRERHGIICPII